MASLFVTATGTEVGKTFVSAGLLRAAQRAGLSANAIKPVLSGFSPDRIAESDTAALAQALGRPADFASVSAMAPWRFAAPLSPDMAAERERRSIDVEAVVSFCRETTEAWGKGDRQFLVIEGIGGIMVPLCSTLTVLDLIDALHGPVLLVTSASLGTLSHTLTALATMQAKCCLPIRIVINDVGQSAVPLDDTAAVLRRFYPALPFSTLTHAAGDDAFDDLLAALHPSLFGGASLRDGRTAP